MSESPTADRIARRLRMLEFAIWGAASFTLLTLGVVMAVLSGEMDPASGVQVAIIAGIGAGIVAMISNAAVIDAVKYAGGIVDRWRGNREVAKP